MIDLHTHLLPGIDDGPDTLEQSIELCQIAAAAGTTHAIVTPHIHPGRWENSKQAIAQACNNLQQTLNEKNIPLQLGYAGEVRLTDQIMQQVTNQEIPFYGEVDGYQIMLLEFPHGHVIPGSNKLVAWLLENKIRPLIAHPERNRQIMKDPDQLTPFIDAGCWLQLTAGSVLGAFGEKAKAVAHQLLQDDLVTVVASDGHNSGARKPALGEALDYLGQYYGGDTPQRLLIDNPACITASQFSAGARRC